MKDEKKLLVEYVKTLENDILVNQYDNKDDKQKDVDNLMKSIDRLNKMNELESLEKEKKVNQKIEEDKLKLEKERLDLEKDKLDLANRQHNSNVSLEVRKIENNSKNDKNNTRVKVIEVVAVPITLFIGKCIFENYSMKKICYFEENHVFTTTPSKQIISNLFRKK